MDKAELLKQLGLSNSPANVKPTLEVVAKVEIDGQEVREHVLNVDEWDMRHGSGTANELINLNQVQAKDHNEFQAAMADFYHAAFHSDSEVMEGGPKRRQEFIENLLESPDYHALHHSTQWNHVQSKLAAIEFGKQYAKLVAEDSKRQQAQQGKPAKRPKGGLDPACVMAVAEAIDKAEEAVEEYNEMARGLGFDPTANDGRTDMAKMASLYERVKNNPRLRRIVELTGKYRRLAQSRQRLKVTHGYDDMVGVELGGEVARLLPLELAKLATEEFQLDAMRRLVERQSMCRQYQGVEKVSKGPMVGCIDESSSMNGEPIANAKAIALTIAWIAMHQNRSCTLIAFYMGTAHRSVTLMPGKWDEVALVEWLEGFYNGGGTDPIVPLQEVPDHWHSIRKSPGKADLLIITDGQMNVSQRLEESFMAWKKKEQVSLTTIVIASEPGDLQKVSDEVHMVASLHVESEAVSKVLSV